MDAPPGFGWNPEKAERTFADRGISFEFAVRVFLDPSHVDFDATRIDDGEIRRKAVGLIEGKLYVVVYTLRGDTRWIISARRTNAKEDRLYAQVRS